MRVPGVRLWCLGTTSLRPKEINRQTELLLQELTAFWGKQDETATWDNDTQERFAERIAEQFRDAPTTTRAAARQRARTRTSGLVDLGLATDGRRPSPAGEELLRILAAGSFDRVPPLSIRPDSYLYLTQLLKATIKVDAQVVRPLVVLIYLLSRFGELSRDDLTYLVPLCVDRDTTTTACTLIGQRQDGVPADYDALIVAALRSDAKYEEARTAFIQTVNPTDEDLSSVISNRKGPRYDRPWVELYWALRGVRDALSGGGAPAGLVDQVRTACRGLSDGNKQWWKGHLLSSAGRKLALRLNADIFAATSLEDFHAAFFDGVHVAKSRATLRDYLDLNRRYLALAEILHFTGGSVSLTLPAQALFGPVAADLFRDLAFVAAEDLHNVTTLGQVSQLLAVPSDEYLRRLRELVVVQTGGTLPEDIELDADGLRKILDRIRLSELLQGRFTTEVLGELLAKFDERQTDRDGCDAYLAKNVTDNADAPTVLEWVVGLCWYVISGQAGDLTSFLRMSLDADLLPVTHAAGGGADIVYDYSLTEDYPAHQLLIEVTLNDVRNARIAEMESVSRHLGDWLLRPGASPASYCVFLAPASGPNLIEDFRQRKTFTYFDPSNSDRSVVGLTIFPLLLSHLRRVLLSNTSYESLYATLHAAPGIAELPSQKWLDWVDETLVA